MAKKPQAPRSGSLDTITRNYEFRFYPNKAQREYFTKNAGCANYVYNEIVAWFKTDQELYKELVKVQPDYYKVYYNRSIVNYLLTTLKEFTIDDNGTNWLAEASSTSVQLSAYRALDAIKRHLNGISKTPRFKSRTYRQSIPFTSNAFSVDGNELKLQKLKDPIRFRRHRKLPSAPSNAVVIRKPSGKYFVVFTCTFVPTPRPHGTKVLGIDLGITTLATLSDGTELENPKYYEQSLDRLSKAQAKLSKIPKGSKSYNYQRIRVARKHEYVANQRKNHLHQITSKLVSESQALVIESLLVQPMMDKGRLFSRRLMDTGFGMFKDFITYKVRETEACHLFIADTYFPSTQRCSTCYHIPTEKFPLRVRSWTCSECGTTHARDDNAAKNLLHIAESALNSPYFEADKKIHLTNSYGTLIS